MKLSIILGKTIEKHLACSEETSGLFLTLVVSFCWQIIEARDSEIDVSRLQVVLKSVSYPIYFREGEELPVLLSTQIYSSLPALVVSENCISALLWQLLVNFAAAVILELLFHSVFKHIASLSPGE